MAGSIPDPLPLSAGTGIETGRRALNIFKKGPRYFGADAVLSLFARASAVMILVMMALLLVVLFRAALPSIKAFGAKFLVTSAWRPNELEVVKKNAAGKMIDDAGNVVTSREDAAVTVVPPSFGALPVIYGTAISSVIALGFAIPLSLGAALFLVRIAPRIDSQAVLPIGKKSVQIPVMATVSFLIEFLAAIPSIAYGIWGLFVLAPVLQKYVEPMLNRIFAAVPGLRWLHFDGMPVGRDMFCGGLVLGIMVLPIITAVARDVLRAVPRAQIEGTQALGATWWQSSYEMLRYSRSGLFGAIMLGLARAAGETMAVTMVIGNATKISASWLAPAQTMSSLLANEFREADRGLHTSALVEVALILLVMSLAFNMIARYLVVGKHSTRAA